MKLKSLTGIGAFGLLCLALPGSLLAEVTYSYTGTVYGSYEITLSFNTVAPLTSLAPDTNISGEISSFTISDGSSLPRSTDEGGFSLGVHNFDVPSTVEVGTDALGNITSWDISDVYFASYPAFPGEDPTDFYCNYTVTTTNAKDSTALTKDEDAGLCPGISASTTTAGTWKPQFTGSSVPEPRTTVLLGVVLGVLALAARRKREVRPIAG